jgi:hypothetical protein
MKQHLPASPTNRLWQLLAAVASYVWGRSSGRQSGAIYSLQRSSLSVRKEGLDQEGPIEGTKEMRSPIAIAHWGKWRAHLQLMPDPAG